LNVHGVNDVRQIEIHTAQPLLPKLSATEKLPIKELERHKTPGTNHIPAELIKAGGRTIHSELHKLINSIWNKEELTEQWSQSLYLSKKGSKADCSNYRGLSFFPATYNILSNILLSRLTPYAEEIIGDH